MHMKITDIRVHTVSLGPLATPFWNSIVKTTGRGGGRVEIDTDEGVTGMAPAGGDDRHFIEGPIKTKLIGEDPARIGYLWQKMYMGGSRKPVAKGDYIKAMSSVDNALWDLQGKALDRPVWKLLGGAQDRVRAYAAGGYYAEGKGLKELCAEMESYVAAGFTAVKMKVGWPGATLREDVDRVAAVRRAVGDKVDLMVDANNAWDGNTALRFGRMIENTIHTGSRSRYTPTTSPGQRKWPTRWTCRSLAVRTSILDGDSGI